MTGWSVTTTAARVSRRRFLGGSAAAAVGAWSAGGVGSAVSAQRGGRANAPPAPTLASLKTMDPNDEAFGRVVRKEYNIVDGLTYMNNGTLGPMPQPVIDANMRYLREAAEDPHALPSTEPVRQKMAAFIGADADEVVLNRSTTEGMKQFTTGLDLKADDEILTSTHEHPGGRDPWRAREKRHGLKVVEVAVPAPAESVDQIVALFEKAITPRTRVLMVSHISFVTGLVSPIKALAEMAHRKGLLFSVDAAHALGMLDLNLHDYGIDHYSAAGQKWLMAGTGNGVAYFKKDVQDRVWADMASANENATQGARKYERSGQRNIPSALGMGDAIDFQMMIGKQNVEPRVKQLATRVKNGIKDVPGGKVYTPMSPELSGGLTTFSIREVPKAVVTKVLMDKYGIFIPASGFNDFSCRVSTHVYTMQSDVDRLLAGLRDISDNATKYTSSTAPAAPARDDLDGTD
jgi:selenocysteine lyase/cysteine desulfurase